MAEFERLGQNSIDQLAHVFNEPDIKSVIEGHKRTITRNALDTRTPIEICESSLRRERSRYTLVTEGMIIEYSQEPSPK